MAEEDVSINLANTTITVAGAGLEECNGEYVVTDISYRHDKPKWCNTKTSANMYWWGGGCGWEMYYNNGGMCKYWTGQTDEDTYPWKLKG